MPTNRKSKSFLVNHITKKFMCCNCNNEGSLKEHDVVEIVNGGVVKIKCERCEEFAQISKQDI